MELIDRQEAIDAIYDNEFSNWCDKDEVSTILNDLPTIEAIPISFIETRLTELAKERNKYEIGTPKFRYVDMQIYYYEMIIEDWKPTLTEWERRTDETD